MISRCMSNRQKTDKIFTSEHQVMETAKMLLDQRKFDSEADCENYRLLYEEYKNLVKQTTKLVHMADRVQLELRKLAKELEKASQVDVMTSIYNRMFFMKTCENEWKSAIRTGIPLALLMIDVDFFKEYNDTYGHVKGDKCLQRVAKQLCCDAKRPRDAVGRYGGDEFAVLLPETDTAGAGVIAANIVKNIYGLNIAHEGSERHRKVTLSVGVTAIAPKQDDSLESLFQQADLALYRAKTDGRNCFRIYERIQEGEE